MGRIQDPESIIRGVIDSRPGWRPTLIEFVHGPSPRRAVEGLADPDGLPWEALPIPKGLPTKPTERRRLAALIHNQLQTGYNLWLVEVGGQWFLAERFRDNIGLWDGLEPVGDWVDSSCGDMPAQHHQVCRFRGQPVSIYIRWRHQDPWHGYVVQGDMSKDVWETFRRPWSPNLLPIDRPDPNPGPRPSFLEMLSKPEVARTVFRETWITKYEEHKAKQTLIIKADEWLRENNDKPEAWTGPGLG